MSERWWYTEKRVFQQSVIMEMIRVCVQRAVCGTRGIWMRSFRFYCYVALVSIDLFAPSKHLHTFYSREDKKYLHSTLFIISYGCCLQFPHPPPLVN